MSKKIPINFELLIQNHPTSGQIKSNINLKEMIEKLPLARSGVKELCAVKLSYALNHSNAKISDHSYSDRRIKGTVRAKVGDDGLNYIFSTIDFAVYLDKKYFKAENHKGSKEKMKSKIDGRKGIISFGYRHVDLWEGHKWHFQDYYIDLWKCGSAKKNGIFFWETL